MQWANTENGGFSQEEPWIPLSEKYRPEITVETQLLDEDSILNFYKKLIHLRKQLPVISEGRIEFIKTGQKLWHIKGGTVMIYWWFSVTWTAQNSL